MYKDVGVQIQGETTPKTTTSIDAVVKQGFAELQRIIQDAIETTTKATTTTGSFTMEPEITTTTSPMNLDVKNNEDVEEYSTLFIQDNMINEKPKPRRKLCCHLVVER